MYIYPEDTEGHVDHSIPANYLNICTYIYNKSYLKTKNLYVHIPEDTEDQVERSIPANNLNICTYIYIKSYLKTIYTCMYIYPEDTEDHVERGIPAKQFEYMYIYI